MANDEKVVINLATGIEDAERVTVAFLVGGAALEQGKRVAMFLTKEAVRLGLPGYQRRRRARAARRSRESSLVPNARLVGATPLWERIGEGARAFSY